MPNVVMTDELYEKLNKIFTIENQDIETLNKIEQDFFYDMQERFVKYQRDIFITENQLDWLNRIRTKCYENATGDD